MDVVLIGPGVACLIAAAAGVGIKAASIEIGAVNSPRNRLLLAVLGVLLIISGYVTGGSDKPDKPSTGAESTPSSTLSRSAGPSPTAAPAAPQTRLRNDMLQEISRTQHEAVALLTQGRTAQAIALIDENSKRIEVGLEAFPKDAEFHATAGYRAKDMYQSTKGVVSTEKRRDYLSLARRSFEHALSLNPDSASAHNGLGNVLFFEGRFDAAIKEHDTALRLAGGNYPEAEQDKQLVIQVRDKKQPFDF